METNKYAKLAEVILNNFLENPIKYDVQILRYSSSIEINYRLEDDDYRTIIIYANNPEYTVKFLSSTRQAVISGISETDYHRLMVIVNDIEAKAKDMHFEELNNLFTESENID
jgi:hypothetical protein